MSNNAAVTADGGEIGRAQALQARAARIPPSVHMNPVLLKPQSETDAQVVVQGRIVGNTRAHEYQLMKALLLERVLESYARLESEADLILIEGAGSASEINLRHADIANMGFSEAAGVPVVLIGDIERGGVIASLVGTKAVLPPDDARRIVGFIVNKFRGDPDLFAAGMSAIAERTGWRPLGLVPHFARASHLPPEDSQSLPRSAPDPSPEKPLVVVLAYPLISNFDDLDPLRLEPGVELAFLHPGEAIPGRTSLVILPGSKATMADLAALRATGWDIDLAAHAARGGRVLGICGGLQMLGEALIDTVGVDGNGPGLGLLPLVTSFEAEKTVRPAHTRFGAVQGAWQALGGVPVQGYEIHHGQTAQHPAMAAKGDVAREVIPGLAWQNGAGNVLGLYLHGLFEDGGVLRALFGAGAPTLEQVFDRMAEGVGRWFDPRVLEI